MRPEDNNEFDWLEGVGIILGSMLGTIMMYLIFRFFG